MAVIRSYDTERHPFGQEIARILRVPADVLHLVHVTRADLLPRGPLTAATETRTGFHDLVVAATTGSATSTARDVYQAFPTFRLQLPGERAVHTWHYDSDPDHRHPDWEINFQIALTDMLGSRATWIESVPGLRDFAPMELTVGQFAVFDGNRCLHGNRPNDTGLSRVSLDFRVLPWSRYAAQTSRRTSVTAGKRFVAGEYYERFHHRAGVLPT